MPWVSSTCRATMGLCDRRTTKARIWPSAASIVDHFIVGEVHLGIGIELGSVRLPFDIQLLKGAHLNELAEATNRRGGDRHRADVAAPIVLMLGTIVCGGRWDTLDQQRAN